MTKLKCERLQGEGTPLYQVMACLLDIKKRTAKTEASFGPLQDTVQSLSNDKNHADRNERGEHLWETWDARYTMQVQAEISLWTSCLWRPVRNCVCAAGSAAAALQHQPERGHPQAAAGGAAGLGCPAAEGCRPVCLTAFLKLPLQHRCNAIACSHQAT